MTSPPTKRQPAYTTCCPHCGHNIEPPHPPPDYGLTVRQTKLLGIIEAYIEKHGVAPIYAEMAEMMGLKSKSGIHHIVQGLVHRGRIVMLRDRWRSIKIIAPISPRFLPVAGETPDAARGSAASGQPLSSGVDGEVFA